MKQTVERDAQIIEAYIGYETPIPNISLASGLSETAVKAIIDRYYHTSELPDSLPSKVNLSARNWYIYENWQYLPIDQIAEVLAISTVTVKRIASDFNFPKKDRIVVNSVKQHYRHRVTLLNIETGIFYLSEKEAAETIGMKYNTFKGKLGGYKKNTTSFIRV